MTIERFILEQPAVLEAVLRGVPGQLAAQWDIGILPINIRFGNKVYRDSVDLSAAKAYELFAKDPDAFSTSPASLPLHRTSTPGSRFTAGWSHSLHTAPWWAFLNAMKRAKSSSQARFRSSKSR